MKKRSTLKIPSNEEIQNKLNQSIPNLFHSSIHSSYSHDNNTSDQKITDNDTGLQEQLLISNNSSPHLQPICSNTPSFPLLDDENNDINMTSIKDADSRTFLVNPRQKKNPLLKYLKIPFQFCSIIPDFQMGITNCALCLSLHYHLLHPNYISQRISLIRSSYRLRVLIVLIDYNDYSPLLKDLSTMAIHCRYTLICVSSWEEMALYLESFHSSQNKTVEHLQPKKETDINEIYRECLNLIRPIQKIDISQLSQIYSSPSFLFQASLESLALCPGLGIKYHWLSHFIGSIKVKRLYETFHQPFFKEN